MDYSELPWRSAAILLWLPDGEQPDEAKHFKTELDLSPPRPNPQACWSLGQALIMARVAHDAGDKVPWVKAGEVVLDPRDSLGAYEFFKQHGHGDG